MTDSGTAQGQPLPSIFERASQAADHILSLTKHRPRIALILGSGLGAFSESLTDGIRLPYSEVPGFGEVTVPGHSGTLAIGLADGVPVAVMSGRLHYYEGHSLDDVTFPVRALRQMGIRYLLITNSSGGLNASYKAGDFMLIEDHINLTGLNPLLGPNIDEFGTRFPDMTFTYDRMVSGEIEAAAKELSISLQRGIYAGLVGPTYETPAEVRMLQILGADAVGMSTVPEVIAARHAGVVVGGISVVANVAAGMSDEPLNHAEIEETANKMKEAFVALLGRSAARIAQHDAFDSDPLPGAVAAASGPS